LLTALGLCASAFGGHLDLKAIKLGDSHFCGFCEAIGSSKREDWMDWLLFWINIVFR